LAESLVVQETFTLASRVFRDHPRSGDDWSPRFAGIAQRRAASDTNNPPTRITGWPAWIASIPLGSTHRSGCAAHTCWSCSCNLQALAGSCRARNWNLLRPFLCTIRQARQLAIRSSMRRGGSSRCADSHLKVYARNL